MMPVSPLSGAARSGTIVRVVLHALLPAMLWLVCGAPVLTAQQMQTSAPLSVPPLRVHPQQLAAGVRETTQAGEHTLADGTVLYVPARAVGARRVPLVVVLHGGGVTPQQVLTLQRPPADRYGVIVAAPALSGPAVTPALVQRLDTLLTQLLQQFAIDPQKIAITGMSNGGYPALVVGCMNPAVFRRVAPLSPVPSAYPPAGCRAAAQAGTRFFVSAGIGETKTSVDGLLQLGQQLHQDGNLVQVVLNLRPHQDRLQDEDHLWRWLVASWLKPETPAWRPLPPPADPLVPLTDTALTQLTDFWRHLKRGATKVQLTAPFVDQKTMQLTVGPLQVWVFDMVDMPTLAATYAPIAQALTQARLTARQEERYRAALIGARATKIAAQQDSTLAMSATLRKNVTFLKAHEPAVNTLLDMMGVPRCEATIQATVGC